LCYRTLDSYVIRYEYNSDYYCSEECCPDEIWNKIYCKDEREYELKIALGKVGLTLRNDSRLCSNYIENNEGSIEFIVERMCQMKFLFDYHNMNYYIQKANEEQNETIEAGYFPDTSALDDAEYEVMKQYDFIYPKMWCFPWQKVNSIEDLMRDKKLIIPEFLGTQYNINRCLRKLQRKIKEKIYDPDNNFIYDIHTKNMEKLNLKKQISLK
jgi:hypothetical protein